MNECQEPNTFFPLILSPHSMVIRWFPSIYLGKFWDSILKQSMTTSKHNNLIILRYLPYYQEEIFQTSTLYCSIEFVLKVGGKQAQN
jgi:hypothetical protein